MSINDVLQAANEQEMLEALFALEERALKDEIRGMRRSLLQLASGGDVQVHVCGEFDHLLITLLSERGASSRMVLCNIDADVIDHMEALLDIVFEHANGMLRQSDEQVGRGIVAFARCVHEGDDDVDDFLDKHAANEQHVEDAIEELYQIVAGWADDFVANNHDCIVLDTHHERELDTTDSFYIERPPMADLDQILGALLRGLGNTSAVVVGPDGLHVMDIDDSSSLAEVIFGAKPDDQGMTDSFIAD